MSYQPAAREQGGYELGAVLAPLARFARVPLSESDRLFLEAALVRLP